MSSTHLFTNNHYRKTHMVRRKLHRWLARLGTFGLVLTCVLSLCNLTTATAQEAAETPEEQVDLSLWTSPEGKEIKADFVRLSGDKVVLRLKSTGKEASVPLSALSLESHLQALKLANPDAFSKPVPTAEVAAALSIEIPDPTFTVEEALKSPFTENPSIEQFLETLKTEMERGNVMVVWHALPSRMQQDIERIIAKGAESLGDQRIIQFKSLLKSVNSVVSEKQKFLVGYPLIAAQPMVSKQITTAWPLVNGVVSRFTNPELWETENFKSGNIIPWMARVSVDMSPFSELGKDPNFQSMGLSSPEVTYKILSQSADSAEVEFSIGPQMPPTTVKLVRFEKIWIVPAYMADLRKGVDEALSALDKGVDTSAVGVGLFAVNAVVGSLERAETQEEFNAAVDDILKSPFAAGFMNGLNRSRGGPPPGSGAAPSGGGPGTASGGRSGGGGPRNIGVFDGPGGP